MIVATAMGLLTANTRAQPWPFDTNSVASNSYVIWIVPHPLTNNGDIFGCGDGSFSWFINGDLCSPTSLIPYSQWNGDGYTSDGNYRHDGNITSKDLFISIDYGTACKPFIDAPAVDIYLYAKFFSGATAAQHQTWHLPAGATAVTFSGTYDVWDENESADHGLLLGGESSLSAQIRGLLFDGCSMTPGNTNFFKVNIPPAPHSIYDTIFYNPLCERGDMTWPHVRDRIYNHMAQDVTIGAGTYNLTNFQLIAGVADPSLRCQFQKWTGYTWVQETNIATWSESAADFTVYAPNSGTFLPPDSGIVALLVLTNGTTQFQYQYLPLE